MGNRIYGCDDCLAVCPWNRFARAATNPGLRARVELNAPHLAELAALDDVGFRTMFSASPIKRIGRGRFVRNVLIAIGNSGDVALLATAAERTGDPDPVVADAACWAVRRLEGGDGVSGLTKRSFSLAGHRTSVALEETFWEALAAIASERGQPLSALVTSVDAGRTPGQTLASALRIVALKHYLPQR
jgi:predicted DNA-binding ribbon-helix-helix protein